MRGVLRVRGDKKAVAQRAVFYHAHEHLFGACQRMISTEKTASFFDARMRMKRTKRRNENIRKIKSGKVRLMQERRGFRRCLQFRSRTPKRRRAPLAGRPSLSKARSKKLLLLFLGSRFFLSCFFSGFFSFRFFLRSHCFLPYVEVEHDQKNKSSSCLSNHNYILERDSDECQSKFTTQGLR